MKQVHSQEYMDFIKKFERKKTTDDCYTPPLIYEAIRAWTVKEYSLESARIIRPFQPDGDYESEDYSGDCVVIDNPPFSILTPVCNWYHARGIRYFLFAPALTCLSSTASAHRCAIITNNDIIYENGARVRTAFVTNLDTAAMRTAPELAAAVDAAVKQTRREETKPRSKYAYPANVVTAAMLQSVASVDFRLERAEASDRVGSLESQRAAGKAIFGGGYLIGDKAAARLEAAKSKAARLEAAKSKAERLKAVKEATVWTLSTQEKTVIDSLE